jgi:hypothetical protein
LPLVLRDGSGTLSGTVTVDEVEELVGWLRASRRRPRIAMRDCNHLHTAALQALAVFQPKVSTLPADAFLAAQVSALLSDGTTPTRRDGSRSE